MNVQEVNNLREEIFADGVVTKEEVTQLWDKKDSMEEECPEFDTLFADVCMAYLFADGKLDDEEAQFLIEKINEDENIDDAEDELLLSIAERMSEGAEVSSVLIGAFPDYFEGG